MAKSIHHFNPVSSELLQCINLIEASAGTGKTYTIAMLVLRLVVEKQLDIKQILVVTFTKAATEELKERIRQRLSETRLSLVNQQPNSDSNIQDWLDTLTLPAEQIIQRLNLALLDIDQAGIFTIHGFCQRILSEHALESGQLFDAELTGDISTVKQACADDFWRQQIYPRSQWEASLLTTNYQTPDQLLTSVDYISPDLCIFPETEDLDAHLEKLTHTLIQHKDTLQQNLLALQQHFTDGKFKKSFETQFTQTKSQILQWLNRESYEIPDFSILSQTTLLDALSGTKFRRSKNKPDSAEQQKINYLDELSLDYDLFEDISLQIQQTGLILRRNLLAYLYPEINKRLQQQNILSFDDLISRFSSALKDEKGPQLCEQVQLHFRAALIDEFQDTDQNQWFIFSSLFDSAEHYLYLIGDPKQAIYKFRGADINSYFIAQQQAHQHFTLSSNWRSNPRLVEACNTLFARNQPFYSENLAYHPANAALDESQGCVLKNQQPVPVVVLSQLDKTEKEYWTAGKAAQEIKTAIVNEIVALLGIDYQIQKRQQSRTIQAEDIAILVATNTQAKEFQQLLNAARINAVINSKESVFSSIEAVNLFKLLQAIAQPQNTELFKQALTLDWFNLDGQQLFHLLNDEIQIDAYLSRFLDYQQVWHRNGVMSMMQQLLSNEKILTNLSQKVMAERRISNLQHCIELVQQAALDEHLGINKTLDWLHRGILQAAESNSPADEQQLRLESDDNAVKIITMHSSKGLEFPIVFCPFLWQRKAQLKKATEVIKCHKNNQMIADLGSDLFEQHREIALQEELAEDLRVLYVALTRAKYRCYLNWADVRSKNNPNDSALAYLLDFADIDFSQQQARLQQLCQQQPEVFQYQLLDSAQSISSHYQPQTEQFSYTLKARTRSLYSNWQMSSYTALSSLSIDETPELPEDKADEQRNQQAEEIKATELPRGPHTGNVIHELLEKVSFQQLATGADFSQQRDNACLRYGLTINEPERIDALLKTAVNSSLTETAPEFKLKNLSSNQCLKEMPFYLSMQNLQAEQINQLLQDEDSFQALNNKTLAGYLTGFIDLVCLYEGKYYVMDYKSNALVDYQPANLVSAMREHNYGLQYWLYTLVLHQYLKNRLADYDYQQHMGGVKYLFVRGMDAAVPQQGIYQAKPAFDKINQLATLFGL